MGQPRRARQDHPNLVLLGHMKTVPRRVVLGLLTLVLAFPVATWWVIGDVSETLTHPPDYLVRPPEIPKVVENAIGGGALAAWVVAATVVFTAWKAGEVEVHEDWWWVLGMVLAAGGLAAVGERIVTAGTSGANIGGGFVLLFGIPLIIVSPVGAAALAWRTARKGRR